MNGILAPAIVAGLLALWLGLGAAPGLHVDPPGSKGPGGEPPPPANPNDRAVDLANVWLAVRALLVPGQERTVSVPCAENQTATMSLGNETVPAYNFTLFANGSNLHLDFELFLVGSNMTEWEGKRVTSVVWTDSANRSSDYADENVSIHITDEVGGETDAQVDHVMSCGSLAGGEADLLEFGATLHFDDGTQETVVSRMTFVRVEASMADVWNWEMGKSCPVPACA